MQIFHVYFVPKEATPNIVVWPERLGAMLEYWYIERGLIIKEMVTISLYVIDKH